MDLWAEIVIRQIKESSLSLLRFISFVSIATKSSQKSRKKQPVACSVSLPKLSKIIINSVTISSYQPVLSLYENTITSLVFCILCTSKISNLK